MQINPIKAHWGKGSWPFSFERLATFPPQADHVLGELFSSWCEEAGGLRAEPPPVKIIEKILLLYYLILAKFEVKKGDQTAQLICAPIFYPEIEEVWDLDNTERGSGGFGPTVKSENLCQE